MPCPCFGAAGGPQMNFCPLSLGLEGFPAPQPVLACVQAETRPRRNDVKNNGSAYGQRNGDVASLVGRIFRSVSLYLALIALGLSTITAGPAQAAPFAAVIMDARTGEVLWEQNADARLHPASLTKMMTLYIAFQEIEAGRLSLDTMVTVSKHAAAQPPSRLGLKPGQRIAMRHLIRAAAIKSANDAATAIGEHIAGGSEARFAQRMTKTARALGMRNTTFRNANGLTAEGHLSSARDMNLLGRHLFYDFPQYYNIFSRRSADAGVAQVVNTNSRFLNGYEGADGIKTGYTVAAGFNLTASAKRGDKRIIATVFGGTSTAQRNAKMTELMNRGFGLAKDRVRERRPNAAPVPQQEAAPPMDALIASAVESAIDTPNVPGGAAKTVSVSGQVSRSLRPKSRPDAPAAAPEADAVALAIAASVQESLSEPAAAATAPPPEGTLEAQAVAMAAAPETAAEAASRPQARPDAGSETALASAANPNAPDQSVIEALVSEVAAADTFEAQAAALAAAAPAPTAGTLEAQAVALAAAPEAAPVEPPLTEAQPDAAPVVDTALAAIRPMPRPERPAALAAPVEEPAPTALAEAEPVLETVAPAAPQEFAEAEQVTRADPVVQQLAEIEPELETPAPALTAVQTVAAVTPTEPSVPVRRAPVFEPVTMAAAAELPEEELVVVTKSTSGGRAWGVNVGGYNSRYEAERALLRTGLAESATLEQGLRKVTQSGGKYRASFLGLNQDQADLACRRLKARGMACETIGPG